MQIPQWQPQKLAKFLSLKMAPGSITRTPWMIKPAVVATDYRVPFSWSEAEMLIKKTDRKECKTLKSWKTDRKKRIVAGKGRSAESPDCIALLNQKVPDKNATWKPMTATAMSISSVQKHETYETGNTHLQVGLTWVTANVSSQRVPRYFFEDAPPEHVPLDSWCG